MDTPPRNEAILRRANEVPIEGQQKHLRLQWLGHVMRINRNHVQRQLLCSRLTGKVRPRGGTPLWWIDLVATDLARTGRRLSTTNLSGVKQSNPALHPHEDKGMDGVCVCMCTHVWCPLHMVIVCIHVVSVCLCVCPCMLTSTRDPGMITR